ncbi:hypothetical protein C345_02079 [Cryptococcus neoformans A2-102-5]|nr:hypothetical protein C368_05100 [Cryptococcus neoformans var. grubii 125.91]OXG89672.1 hypothetical protein C346_02212 [Cryptococcus neoformans var. grubii D17-1]OXG97263.1 hypothetical protein C345_02079 [Cryptococcus neoformans var. grubii A2-102-5]
MPDFRQVTTPSRLFIVPSYSSMGSPSKYLLQPPITPIPILPQTQSAPTMPFRSNVETLNSATPLLPEKEGSFFHNLCRGHWHFPWRRHQSNKCSSHYYGHARLRGCVWLLWKIMLATLIGIFLYWWGWQDARDQRLTLFNQLQQLPISINTTISTTKGVTKIWANSHNDEMQGKDALTLALKQGFGYIEIDTHLDTSSSKNSSLTLLTGHEVSDLNSNRTVKNLYLDPLLAILDAHNQAWTPGGEKNWTGVYEDDPREEVTLFFDIKSDGDATWPYLEAALQPFLSKGYLTTYNTTSNTLTPGPLTVVGTGNTPLHRVYYSPLRYIFYDAPLLELYHPYTLPASQYGPETTIRWHPTISPIASAKFPLQSYLALGPGSRGGGINPFSCNLKLMSAIAKEMGIQSRWWGVLHKPGWARRMLWEMIWESGAGVINADELEDMGNWLRAHEGKERSLKC